MSNYCKNCYELAEKLEAKEQECDELERLYKELQDDMLACNKCRTTIKLQQQLDQLKQTLSEIKEIAEKEVNTKMLFADKESFCDFNKILQKVSEAIQDEN